MNSEQLAAWLQQNLARFISTHLTTQSIDVRPVLNWGGFVNHSFCITNASVRYHLKITSEPDRITRLQPWRDLHEVLEQRYQAPKWIDWIDLPEIGFSGFLQEHIDGSPADLCNPYLVAEIASLLSDLHADDEIRSYFQKRQPAKTYFDHFVETYIERFTSDLQAIAADMPPFISADLFAFMQEQTLQLRESAAGMRAFQLPAKEPVHGDLNEGNVLVTPDQTFVVDWDDLSLGDPAVDYAIAFWPWFNSGRGLWRMSSFDRSARLRKRVHLCLRAQLLDEVIDTVADYVQSGAFPSRQSEVQLTKKRQHEEALRKYRATYS